MSFASDIANYAKKTKLGIDEAVVAVNLQLTRNIIQKTPSDTGRLRSNWMPSFDTPSSVSTTSIGSKQSKISEVQSDALNSAGKVFFLTNNLVYAYAIEYGHSKIKSPEGMVRVSLLEIKQALRKFKTVK